MAELERLGHTGQGVTECIGQGRFGLVRGGAWETLHVKTPEGV